MFIDLTNCTDSVSESVYTSTVLKKNLNKSGVYNSPTESSENNTDHNSSPPKSLNDNENKNENLKYKINVNNAIKRFAYRQ